MAIAYRLQNRLSDTAFEPTLPLDVVLDMWMTKHPEGAAIKGVVIQNHIGDILQKHIVYFLERYSIYRPQACAYGLVTSAHEVFYIEDIGTGSIQVLVCLKESTHV